VSRTTWIVCACYAIGVIAAAAPAAEQPSEAHAVVAALNDSLMAVLKQANDIDYARRFELLGPTLDHAFDLPYMARQAVGRAFLNLDEAERETWYGLFRTYMTATYAARFDRFSDQRFEILGEEPGAGDTVLVRTRVIDPGGEDVDLSYRLRATPAGWKVIDVFLKGTVSELALRRSEYAAVLKREGFAALVGSVEQRIEEFAKGSSDD
jgi:phospholipid transport system substrate-binding protein